MALMTQQAPGGTATARRIPWWEPQLTGAEATSVLDVLASRYLNDGDVTTEFERRIAALFGASHAVATTSGTTAIFLALAAVGVGPGDEVIVPDVTFIATANAVRLTGATPVLVDIDPLTLNLDPERVAQAIGPRTKALVPVHVSGRAADMPAVLSLARARGLAVVEDAAEALLSKVDGRCLGTIGDAGCLSFSPNKTITTGQGGMVLTNDDGVAARLRGLKDHGRPVRGTGGNDLHPTLGFNFKLTNLQSAVGLAQLAELEPRAAKLRQTFRIYRDSLSGVDGITLPGFAVDRGESPQWIDAVAERRDALIAFLLERNMHCRPFWFPLHTQQPYRRADTEFPESSRMSPRAMWLPSALSLTDEDVVQVCHAIREFYAAT
jgi:perosamine synthetase